MLLEKKRAQAWGFDLIIAFMIFIAGILIFYMFTINSPDNTSSKLSDLTHESEVIASTILSEGFPKDWNEDNVAEIGILSKEKINQTKIEKFYALSISDYNKTKSLFNTRYNYYITSSSKFEISGEEIDGIGQKYSSSSNLVRTSRLTIYKNKPVTIDIYLWE